MSIKWENIRTTNNEVSEEEWLREKKSILSTLIINFLRSLEFQLFSPLRIFGWSKNFCSRQNPPDYYAYVSFPDLLPDTGQIWFFPCEPAAYFFQIPRVVWTLESCFSSSWLKLPSFRILESNTSGLGADTCIFAKIQKLQFLAAACWHFGRSEKEAAYY